MKRETNEFTDFFKFSNLTSFSGLKHFVSTKINKTNNNDLDLSYNTGKDHEIILNNRKMLSKAVNIPLESFVIQNQIHGDTITVIEKAQKGFGIYDHKNSISDSDAMISNGKGLCLFLFAADCVPVLIYDPKLNVIGAVHSGWKGTIKNVVQKTVLKMNKVFHSEPKDLLIGIGPSISVENYEIGNNVVEAVVNTFGTKENYLLLNKETGNYHFDLKYAIKKQLTDIGVILNNIEVSNFCTFDNPELFFSARRNNNTGRFGAGIMLK